MPIDIFNRKPSSRCKGVEQLRDGTSRRGLDREPKILNEPPADGDRSHLKKTAKAKFFQANQKNMSIGKA